MDKFIYVFNENAKNKLIDNGYFLLISDEHNSTYIFENKAEFCFALEDISYITSDTLSL